MRRAIALAAAALLLASCGGDDDDGVPAGLPEPTSTAPAAATSTTSAAPTPSTPALADVEVSLTLVARVVSPTAMAAHPGDGTLYVTEQRGRVVALRDGGPETFLDISGDVSAGGERGLLGIALSPDGGVMYLDYTDAEGDTRIEAVDMATRARRLLLRIEQPYANHNGGQLAVRPDGTLWIGMGDGGSGGDPQDRAQNLRELLGKILRIDPRPSGDRPYSIPADNPFAGRDDARPEIWAYGLRNPWRFSFDRETGDLWIADVGQNAWEEVSFEPAGSRGGRNYGWDGYEGSHVYEEPVPPGAVRPILEYSHRGGGVSVTGGYVYRGSKIPGLQGAYLYADYAEGEVLAVRQSGGRVVEQASLALRAPPLSSFGEDLEGELYVLSLSGRVYRVDPA